MNSLRAAAHRLRDIPYRDIAKEAADSIVFFAKFGCLLHLTKAHLATVVITYGPSMLPTFNISGDVVLVERLSTRFGRIGVGDIVLARSPEDPRKLITKRVVATEGDHVSFPIEPSSDGGRKDVVVPKGHVWIQGDNVYRSNDSRHFGALPYGLLEGKVFFRIWPLDGFGSLEPRSCQ